MKSRPQVGRRTKLTPRVQKRIVSALRAGNYTTVAAEYGGIGRATFYRWMQRGQQARRGRYRNFFQAVTRALAEAEVRAVSILYAHMATDWQAAIAWLERRFPSRWGLKRSDDVWQDPAEGLRELLGWTREQLDEAVGC